MIAKIVSQLAVGAAVLVLGASRQASACACCSASGDRTDIIAKLSSYHADEIGKLRFGPQAELFLGEAEPDAIKGITTPAAKYAVDTQWQSDRMVFKFRDEAAHSGVLTLARPRTISIFHVDPHGETPSPNHGPLLYKEWRLNSKAAGTGIFAQGLSAGQTLTLVLQGRGNNCTSANDFTRWMLVMWGPKSKYHFFGDLTAAN